MTDELSAREYLESGDNWASRIARLSLPIVIWTAKKGLTITYKQLALELLQRHDEEIKQRMTVYGWPAGRIGRAIERLSDEWGENVPLVNAIVVNAQTGLPGHGVDSFVRRYMNREAKRRLTQNNRDELAEELMQTVHDYTEWDAVATYFGIKKLPSVSQLVETKNEDDPIKLPPMPKKHGGAEESDEHQNLKKWAANNPRYFSNFGAFKVGRVEHDIRSGDRLDAYLENRGTCLAIEVKASNVPESELFRGVFQCVKYRATLRAMQLAEGEYPNAQAVLLTTRSIPSEVKRLAKRLRIEILMAPMEAEGD